MALIFLIASLAAAWTVCLDPGHGGSDQGAVGIYCTEKEANLDVAYMARSYLEQVDDCTEVAMTRLEDQYVSLADRVAYANAGGYSVFVSMHHNAFNGSVQGTETYCDQDGSPEDFTLRDLIHPYLVDAFGYFDRGVKTAGFYVLRYTSMPAVLGEASFLDYTGEWDESWRFEARWMDHDGREGWAYCAGLCQDQGSISIPDWQSRVVDNSYPDFTTSGEGVWSTGSGGDPFGPDFIWLPVGVQADSAVWRPYVPLSGWYEVYLRWVSGPDRVTSARVTVSHDQGQEVFLVDQSRGGGEWFTLGSFPFHEGTFGNVTISTDGCQQGRVLVADAARFSASPSGIEEHSAPGVTGLRVAPNPSSSGVSISPSGTRHLNSVSIYDMSGRLVTRLLQGEQDGSYFWDASGHAAGIYLILAESDTFTTAARVVLLDR